MEKSLATNSRFQAGVNGMIVVVEGAVDMSFCIAGHNTFKLQGSSDGGATYNDIAGTSFAGDGTATGARMESVFMCQKFDHVKCVLDQGTVFCVRRWLRSTPAAPSLLLGATAKNVIDPQLGTP